MTSSCDLIISQTDETSFFLEKTVSWTQIYLRYKLAILILIEQN